MSYYVKHTHTQSGQPGWVGPIRSERQANREADARRSTGATAEVLASSPDVRAAVRAWERVK